MKILVLNGPNINMLGIREPGIYGGDNYLDLVRLVKQTAEEMGVEIDCLQTNYEGKLVDWIQRAYGHCDGIVINPAA